MDTWHILEQRFHDIANRDHNVVLDFHADNNEECSYSLSGPVQEGKSRLALIGGKAIDGLQVQQDFSTNHYSVTELWETLNRAGRLVNHEQQQPQRDEHTGAQRFVAMVVKNYSTLAHEEGPRRIFANAARVCGMMAGTLAILEPAAIGKRNQVATVIARQSDDGIIQTWAEQPNGTRRLKDIGWIAQPGINGWGECSFNSPLPTSRHDWMVHFGQLVGAACKVDECIADPRERGHLNVRPCPILCMMSWVSRCSHIETSERSRLRIARLELPTPAELRGTIAMSFCEQIVAKVQERCTWLQRHFVTHTDTSWKLPTEERLSYESRQICDQFEVVVQRWKFEPIDAAEWMRLIDLELGKCNWLADQETTDDRTAKISDFANVSSQIPIDATAGQASAGATVTKEFSLQIDWQDRTIRRTIAPFNMEQNVVDWQKHPEKWEAFKKLNHAFPESVQGKVAGVSRQTKSQMNDDLRNLGIQISHGPYWTLENISRMNSGIDGT